MSDHKHHVHGDGNCSPVCFVIPPHIFEEIARRGDQQQQDAALEVLSHSAHIRGHREALKAFAAAVTPGVKRRTIYNAHGGRKLPGKLVLSEGGEKTKDVTTDEAYDSAGVTFNFFSEVYGRNSVDDQGLRLDSTVHYGKRFDNAFWNGAQMVYGSGDGKLFDRFTKCLDVIAHELTHGVTQYEAGLDYQDQPGALNESMSDVFGILVKQYAKLQPAGTADWLIGQGLLMPGIKGIALRSMKAPGTAYDDPLLGRDPQPAHMKDYYEGSSDNGGVHINSGIPNHAFYLAATAIGGNAWEKTGKIWYVTLRDRLRHDSTFADAAHMTVAVAKELYGQNSVEQDAVATAWKQVGVV